MDHQVFGIPPRVQEFHGSCVFPAKIAALKTRLSYRSVLRETPVYLLT